ncbi:MAG: ATP-binding cassette domain-containing protein [Defluviitaleaceae bacterium]|nr:ATP-binding cassette domain-containing protein [Defluviitaleaceae bacterium]MCL2835354.1 ATP-binding cassette domain-containing protein [Defluviitaleaceae bacterium]
MLKVDNVTKIWGAGTADENTAVDALTLNLEEGDFITVVGGNGSGKSTTLNAIAGTFPVDAGKIWINGIDVTKHPSYKRAKLIGRVFQDPLMGSAASLEIQENLALASRRGKRRSLRWGINKKERERYRDLLSILGLGLEDRMSDKVGLLSGGQRQALTLVMATLKAPKLLLLDEHTAALDPKTAAKVLEITETIIKKNRFTTLMVTHNMKDAISLGNRLIMMSEGKIVYEAEGGAKQRLTPGEMVDRFAMG